MPKFLSTADHTRLTALAAAATAALGESGDLDAILAAEDPGASLAAALAPAPVAAEITEEQSANIVAEFFAASGVELGETSAEDALADLSGAAENLTTLQTAASAQGLDLTAALAAEDPAAALKGQLDGIVAKAAAKAVAAAGVPHTDTPDTPPDSAADEPRTEADYLGAIAAAEKAGESAKVSTLYAQMREKFPRKVRG